MPAYFSLTFELNKSRDAVGAFCETLIHCGPVFKSGYWGFENDSFADIITWNQKKLDEDFELGYTEHHSHDYKQMLFDYADFSEVRLFIMNQRRKPVFSFALIVPEYDLRIYEGKNRAACSMQRKLERMKLLKSAAKKMWVGMDLLAIQTGWELSDVPPSAGEIAGGTKPQAEPFCIVPSSCFSLEKDVPFAYEYIERNGVFIEDGTEWNYR